MAKHKSERKSEWESLLTFGSGVDEMEKRKKERKRKGLFADVEFDIGV